MNKYIVIGDIHGCLIQLKEILETIKRYENHKIIFLGDYIDRGPDSEGVIQRIKNMDAIFLKGNHEAMLLNRINMENEAERKRIQNISGLSDDSIEWIKSCRTIYFESPDFLFVHAGFDKNIPLSSQTDRECLWSIVDEDYHEWTEKEVIHGHVIVKDVEKKGNRININTGCGSGGYLTALILPEKEYIRSSISPGKKYNWELIRKELEEELGKLDTL